MNNTLLKASLWHMRDRKFSQWYWKRCSLLTLNAYGKFTLYHRKKKSITMLDRKWGLSRCHKDKKIVCLLKRVFFMLKIYVIFLNNN